MTKSLKLKKKQTKKLISKIKGIPKTYCKKKYFPQYKNMLKYCLKCNNNKKNIGLKKVTMADKVIRAK